MRRTSDTTFKHQHSESILRCMKITRLALVDTDIIQSNTHAVRVEYHLVIALGTSWNIAIVAYDFNVKDK